MLFAMLGWNVILPSLFRRTPLPLRLFSIFAKSLDAVIGLCGYFDCFFIFNQMIFHLLIALLMFFTIIIGR